ncbi:hypothetical protein IFM89_037276 [Coptis chinensis]|uniref:Pentatricopeptide repeat-containing protein n=1 Tax=Coptis chinensis TaxID=261450 RepID=A0A835LXK6_9MAGN|nr:hypothetical protein IFM89_037276 [Coptis chinensis]
MIGVKDQNDEDIDETEIGLLVREIASHFCKAGRNAKITAGILAESNGCTSSASTSQTSNEGSTEAVPSEQPTLNPCFYAKFGEVASAEYLFESMVNRDLVCWSALMSTYAQYGYADKAIKVFRQMEVNGVKPDCMTLVSALSACARLGCLQIGNEIDKFIVEGEFRSNMFINNADWICIAKILRGYECG